MICGISKIDLDVPYVGEDGGREVREGEERAIRSVVGEVDGIFTADPRKVPTARLLSIISPDEAAELTYYGSEVVHPFTMEQVGGGSVSTD